MTPDCSTCGYAVEWLRSCYESEWQLFRERPDVRTPGRFVRSAQGAPHFPGWHNLGSGTWTSDERDPQPALGEANDARRVWSNGSPSLPSAPAVLVGTLACLAAGETYPLPIIDRTFPGNWDSRCFLGYYPPAPTPIPIPDIFLCKSQRQWITAIRLLADGDLVGAVAILQLNLPGYAITAVPSGAGPIPGSLIAVLGDSVVVLVLGTPNPASWSYQLTQGALGPTEYGWYSTLSFWRLSSDVILQRMQAAGLQGTDRVTLIGYSFGGAICCVLAARMLMFQPDRNVQLLTFGCPRPGDARMIALLRFARQLHFVNVDDPIPYLPPGRNELGFVASIVPDILIEQWRSWRSPDNRVGLTAEGVRNDNPASTALAGIIFRTVTRLLLFQEPPVATAHASVEYERRVICPDDPPPGKTPVDTFRDIACWFRPEYLGSAYVDSDILTLWADDGPFGFDATMVPSVRDPFVLDIGLSFGLCAGVRDTSQWEVPKLELGNTHSCYVMASRKWPGPSTASGPFTAGFGQLLASGSPTVRSIIYNAAASLAIASVPNVEGLHLWSIRRRSDHIELWFDGALLLAGVANPTGTIRVEAIRSFVPVPGAARLMVLAEWMAFPKDVDDDQQQAIFDYFTSRYGVP